MGSRTSHRPGELYPIRFTSINDILKFVRHEIACATGASVVRELAPGQVVEYHYPSGGHLRIKVVDIPAGKRRLVSGSIRDMLERTSLGFVTMPVSNVTVTPVPGETYDEIDIIVDMDRLDETFPKIVKK